MSLTLHYRYTQLILRAVGLLLLISALTLIIKYKYSTRIDLLFLLLTHHVFTITSKVNNSFFNI